MGNNPSATTKPHLASVSASASASASASPLSHESSSSRAPSTRRDPKNLIPSQRIAAPPEPSMAQASGYTATHRTRNSQSNPVSHLSHPSPSHSLNSTFLHSTDLSQMGVPQSRTEAKAKNAVRDQPSQPVAVPVPISNIEPTSLRPHNSHSYSHLASVEPSGPPAMQDMTYHLTRPPRLPLPIEEEVHTPGSPIIAPADVDEPVLDIEALNNDTLPRHSSALSNTTIDDDDAEELRVDKTKATVPTVFEWLRGGDKVYVTGTIFQWNKKHRLHPVEGRPGVSRAIIHVRPGTHHIRFIVDTIMQCSVDLPTTVDFGNNLVNYIEVSADDLPRDPTVSTETPATAVVNEKTQSTPTQSESKAVIEEKTKSAKPAPKTRPALVAGHYSSQIPQYLIDLDKAEESAAYKYAAGAIVQLPTPPSLPGFLGKPILNAATPMKDDNSVLNMPNHTVLNHLATSSIKNNVLAVSATTRYKRKYVTTIMYKPTGDD